MIHQNVKLMMRGWSPITRWWLLLLVVIGLANAQTIKKTVLYSFTDGNDGGIPFAGVILAPNGVLYGTTSDGGDTGCQFGGNSCGTVYELIPPSHLGGTWTETTLYTFGENIGDGSIPKTGVVQDRSGNLYGTTTFPNLIYQLVPQQGGIWGYNSVYGASISPLPDPIVDDAGNAYDSDPTANGDGSVLKLSPNGDGTFTTHVIYSFPGGVGGVFPGALVGDGSGRLYGVTTGGGANKCSGLGCGTAFVLLPPSEPGKGWVRKTLYSFQGGTLGAYPSLGLTRDAHGNVYGVAVSSQMCGSSACDLVFRLAPSKKAGAPWVETVLHVFQGGKDGAFLQGGLAIDRHGALFGTTVFGGGGPCVNNGVLVGCGTVFRLSPPASSGGIWIEHVFAFQGGSDGLAPYGTLALDEKNRILYGTTSFGGAHNRGTVFAITR